MAYILFGYIDEVGKGFVAIDIDRSTTDKDAASKKAYTFILDGKNVKVEVNKRITIE